MPRDFPLNKRTVILNTECDEILKVYQAVLADMDLSQEQQKEGSFLSSTQRSPEVPAEDNSINKAKRLLEQVFKNRWGGKKQDLPKCSAELDTGSYALLRSYYDFWVKQMGITGISAETMEREEIEDAYVLIMELYLRLAMQALRWDSPLRSDQKRRIFIDILVNFGVKLSKQDKLSKTLQANLFGEHKKWLEILVKTADQIDDLNKAKPVLKENLDFLESLADNITRYLIICLTDEKQANQNTWKGKLSKNHLAVTLEDCEEQVLSTASQEERIKLKNDTEKGIVEACFVVEKKSSLDYEISGKDIGEHDLFDYGLGSDANRQKSVVGIFKNNQATQLRVKYLYGLLNKTKILYQFLSKIDTLVMSAGWLPILFRVVQLDEVDKAIDSQFSLCDEVFRICQSDKDFYKSCLGTELGICTHKDLGGRKSLPKLGQLQDPALFRTVYEKMALDINQLTKLGSLSGCTVESNPFQSRKPLKNISETVQPLPPMKTITGANRPLAIKSAEGSPDLPAKKIMTSSQPSSKGKGIRRVESFDLSSERPTLMISSPEPQPESHKKGESGLVVSESLGNIHDIKRKKHEKTKSRDRSGTSENLKETKSTFDPKPPALPPFFSKFNKSKSQNPSPAETANSSPILSRKTLSITEEPLGTLYQSPINTPLNSCSDIPALEDEDKKMSTLPASNTSVQEQPPKQESVIKPSPAKFEPPPVSIAMPSISGYLPQVKDEKIYPAKTPYIKAFVERLGLSENEVAEATKIFDTNRNYFNTDHFSPFRRAVAAAVKKFSSSYGSVVPKDDPKEWQRLEEVTMLQYFCIGPRDDSRLFLFMMHMKQAKKPTQWLGSYNNLIKALEGLLDEYFSGEPKAAAILTDNVNTALKKEIEELREKNQKVSKENVQLQEDLDTSRKEAADLRKENEQLKIMADLSEKVTGLTDKVERLEKQIEAKKTPQTGSTFGPLFAAPQEKNQQHLEQQSSLSCNIL